MLLLNVTRPDTAKQWKVVQYLEDGGTLVIPSFWHFEQEGEDFAWYPPINFKASDINKAVNKRDTPDAAVGWRALIATVVAKSSTFAGAQKKMKAFLKKRAIVDTTDMEKKSKKNKMKKIAAPTKTASSHAPKLASKTASLQKMSNKDKKTKQQSTAKGKNVSLSRSDSLLSGISLISSSSGSTEGSAESDAASLSTPISSEDESGSEGAKDGNNDSTTASTSTGAAATSMNGKKGSRASQPEPTPSTSGATTNGNCCPCAVSCCPCAREERTLNERFRRRVIRRLAAIHTFISNKQKASVGPAPEIKGVKFPMSSFEEMDVLQEAIADESEASKLIKYYSYFSDAHDELATVRNTMESLMQDDLVEQFNFDGRGSLHKIGLRKKYPELVKFFLDIMKLTTSHTDSTLTKRMQTYFRRIKEKKSSNNEMNPPPAPPVNNDNVDPPSE